MTDLRKTWRFVNEIGTVHKLLLKKNKKRSVSPLATKICKKSIDHESSY